MDQKNAPLFRHKSFRQVLFISPGHFFAIKHDHLYQILHSQIFQWIPSHNDHVSFLPCLQCTDLTIQAEGLGAIDSTGLINPNRNHTQFFIGHQFIRRIIEKYGAAFNASVILTFLCAFISFVVS